MNDTAIYDNIATTGAVLSAPADSTPAVSAPFGAACESAEPSVLSTLLSARIQAMLDHGCGSSCVDVRVVTLDQAAQFIKDRLPIGHVGPLLSRGPWVCGGDVQVNDTPIYDNDATTGAVLAVPAGAPSVTLAAPFGGTCEAADPSNPSALVNATIQAMLDHGCGSRCTGVRTVLLDTHGRFANDRLPVGHVGAPLSAAPWVCTGDVQVNDVPLYDSDASTGLVLSLPASTIQATIRAPWGASCTAALEQDPETLVNVNVAELLNSGCGGRCRAVRVAYVDQHGVLVRESWRP